MSRSWIANRSWELNFSNEYSKMSGNAAGLFTKYSKSIPFPHSSTKVATVSCTPDSFFGVGASASSNADLFDILFFMISCAITIFQYSWWFDSNCRDLDISFFPSKNYKSVVFFFSVVNSNVKSLSVVFSNVNTLSVVNKKKLKWLINYWLYV